MFFSFEWWSYEIILLLSGLLPNPKVEASVLSIWYVYAFYRSPSTSRVSLMSLSLLTLFLLVVYGQFLCDLFALFHTIWVGGHSKVSANNLSYPSNNLAYPFVIVKIYFYFFFYLHEK